MNAGKRMPPGGYRKVADLPSVIPIFPLAGAIVFPRNVLPLNIFEPRYLNMIDDAMSGSRIIGMIQPATTNSNPECPVIAKIGCAARITSYSETEDGRYLVSLSGLCRFSVESELDVLTPYRQVQPDYQPFAEDLIVPKDPLEVDKPALLEALSDYLERLDLGAMSPGLKSASPEALLNSLAAACPFELPEKQALLEARTLADRAGLLKALFETSGRT